jgi:Zn-finger protein
MDILEIKKSLLNSIKKKNDNFFYCPFECGRKSASRSVILQHLSRIKTCKKKPISNDTENKKNEEENIKVENTKETKEKKKIIITFN